MGPRLIVNITNSLLHSVTEGEAEIAQGIVSAHGCDGFLTPHQHSVSFRPPIRWY